MVDGAAISLRGASVTVGGRTVWRDVDLEVDRGEFVAVLGPNGVGKSTLLKALLGLLPASAGEIRVLGRPAGTAGHAIGYLPQRRSFDPALRIRGSTSCGWVSTATGGACPCPGGRARAASFTDGSTS